MPVMRNWLRESLKPGRSDGRPQSYDWVRSGHNVEMDGDKQPKTVLKMTKGKQTQKQKDTEGKKGVQQTTDTMDVVKVVGRKK